MSQADDVYKFYRDVWLPQYLADGNEHPCLGQQSLSFAEAYASSRLSVLETLVGELVDKIAPLADRANCTFCSGGTRDDWPDEGDEFEHDDGCIYLRAREIRKEKP